MNDLQHRKRQLRSLEDRFKNVIESDSDEMEANLKTYLKVGVIVGVSLLVAYKVYRSLSPKVKSAKKGRTKNAMSSGLIYSAKQRVFAAAATLLYEEFKKHLDKGRKSIEEAITEDNAS